MVYTSGMKVIIGLGNPEKQYTGTRHNVGFAVLDEYARSNDLSFTRSSKFHGDIAEKGTGEHKVLFLKPSTYYNLVGESARAVCDFYRILPQDVLIIHDDLALPLGTLRTRLGVVARIHARRFYWPDIGARLATTYERIAVSEGADVSTWSVQVS